MAWLRRSPSVNLRSLSDGVSLRELVSNLKEAIYITNERGRILDANPAFLELFGVRTLEQLCAYSAADLLLDPAERERKLAALRQRGYIRGLELKIRRPDFQVRTVLETAYKCVDPETGETLYRGILVDISDRKQVESQLALQNTRDPLTGCYNRRWMAEFERRMKSVGWGCIAVDVDHFKTYNDTKGHDAGDEALIQVSMALVRSTRPDDAVIRMGGDEFAVLLQGSAPATIQSIAERLRKIGRQSAVPFSIGWATREGNESLENTLSRADRNMYAIRGLDRGRKPQSVGR